MTLRRLAAAMGAALLTAAPAAAQPFDAMGSAGGWNVFYNQMTGGCFIERETAQGIVMQIGTEAGMLGEGPADSYGFFAVYAPGEAPEVGTDTPLVIVEIGPNSYIGQAHRVARDGYFGGFVVSSGGNDLGWDLQNRRAMTIITANGGSVEVNLLRSDVSAAIEAARACQKSKS